MDQLAGLFDFLSAGGDMAAIALVYIMWRFDRRLLVLETTITREKDNG